MSGTSLIPAARKLPSILIVSPALAAANNGNWHTAARWARMIGRHCRTRIAERWCGEPCDVLIALHARRSAASIEAYHRTHPGRPLVVVLTGTDLYRDLGRDDVTARSLDIATRIVALQDQAPLALEARWQRKCVVIYQSARPLRPAPAPGRVLRVVSVGHLRDEKDPATFMRAAARLGTRVDLRFTQIGDALDAGLAQLARETASRAPGYRWLGGLPRAAARQHIREAHLLVSTSRMEGGAQVIVEAAQAATAVVASKIPGNVGMLGAGHAGWFEVGDDAGLARLVERARADAAFLAALRAQTAARARLFAPAEEARCLLALLLSLLHAPAP